jgi:hypothetical protein
VILNERKDEFKLFQLVGWKQKEIYFHLVKESFSWMLKPFVSAMLVSIIFAMLLSFIFGGWFVVMILSAAILGAYNTIMKKTLALDWSFLGVTLLVCLALALAFSPSLIVPTLIINFITLIAATGLIFATMYFSLKKFYKSI